MSAADVKKKDTECDAMTSKVVPDSNTIVITSGMSSTMKSPVSESREQERAWKAYLASTDAPLTASLLTQMNGEDANMSSTLGFLYDYYGVTEESNQGPPSPQESDGSPGSQCNTSNATGIIPSPASDSEANGTDVNQATTLGFLQTVQQIKPTNSSTNSKQRSNTRKRSVNGKSRTGSQDEGTPTAISTAKSSSLPDVTVVQQVKSQPCLTSCSRPVPVRPTSYPQSTKNPVSDVSALPLSTTPPEAFNFAPYSASLKHPPTVFSTQDKYTFNLEAPTSIVQRRGEDTLTYLNKGQFYAISFEGNVSPPSPDEEIERVKSFVHLVFRDEKDPRAEIEHWTYWHSQQPNPQQRAFDIDRKSCQNIDEQIDEISYNAAGFTWSPNLNAKIVIRINCLSTDFSPQKGVRGIPLHLQIDTYEDLANPDAEPVHRALCQIKVFRDKGAERKNKDESKSAERRLQKWMKQNSPDATSVSPNTLFHPPSKFTRLTPTTPFGPKPVLFTRNLCPGVGNSPGIGQLEEHSIQTSALLAAIRERENKRTLHSALVLAKDELADLEVAPRSKCQRVQRHNQPAVTIYVKKEEEKVYNALMLDNLSVPDLVHAVGSKYGVPEEMIKNVYKRTKKGILVNMDDRMIEQFVDEDDFLIQLDFDNQMGHFELTLSY